MTERAHFVDRESGDHYRVRGRVVRITYVRTGTTKALVFATHGDAVHYAWNGERRSLDDSPTWGEMHGKSKWSAQNG